MQNSPLGGIVNGGNKDLQHGLERVKEKSFFLFFKLDKNTSLSFVLG